MKMWGGRFADAPDKGFMEFSTSIGFDSRLYPYDLRCTRAWARELKDAGVLEGDELQAIESALVTVESEMKSCSFKFEQSDEDIHTAVERRLVELAGKFAGKVRAGRSRNDQVATDMRMFAIEECGRVIERIKALQSALIDQAEASMDIVAPGHTHLQQAQPVLLSHALLAFVHMLERDVALLRTARDAADSLPLGSGALAGTSFAVDRARLAERLGFSRVTANSVDAVSDRDFVCDLLFALSMVMIHLSRLSEQVVLWVSAEWALAELGDAWATGSSLMPQKKNPDAAELVRGKTGRVVGSLIGMLTVLKGLPLSYNRDLQEDKEGLFDAIDTVAGCLAVMTGTLATLTFNRDRAEALAAGGFMTATDLADYLVSKGMEFPEAHRVTGEIVSYCIEKQTTFEALTHDELAKFSGLFGEEALEWLTPAASISRRACHGGTAPEAVTRQIADARAMISR
ncbi:MAG: argininosuccinate lyase [Candidatus Anoxymicrobium japonicum]|uniref:Argininosuccinate lyase n=1 Tax=Candidatus Anoxymicrobium japonicum TaxID=2013648 RepID=A0A2N3G846_9ACTN|nr:MAG: argininosuccinate lyase [Candidatus Anoxymicrobium japonicum]